METIEVFTPFSAVKEKLFQVNKLKFINNIDTCWDYWKHCRFICLALHLHAHILVLLLLLAMNVDFDMQTQYNL